MAVNNPTPQQPIGIFGGTFDPVHLGHIQIARQVLDKCYLQKILFIPCYQPAHRHQPTATPTQRLEMLRLALENYPKFIVDAREIKRQGASFMIDTLQSLKQEYPNISLCLILGSDAFAKLNTWRNWQQLADYTNFIIINRPHIQTKLSPLIQNFLQQATITDPSKLSKIANGAIYQLNISPIPISATTIRQQLKNCKTPLSTLPKKVFNYINSKKIYIT